VSVPTSDKSKVLQFDDGNTAMFRHPNQVPERLRREAVNARMRVVSLVPDMPEGLSEEAINVAAGKAMMEHPEFADEFQDKLIMCFLIDWSYELPVTIDSLGDIPHGTYDALAEQAKRGLPILMPSFAPTPDADSPTERSGD
jgi:hypothetical protein